jgi:hypothetical protein
MDSEAALANSLTNDFKTLMSANGGEKPAKTVGAPRKNARQQQQQAANLKKANLRTCSSTPTSLNVISTTTEKQEQQPAESQQTLTALLNASSAHTLTAVVPSKTTVAPADTGPPAINKLPSAASSSKPETTKQQQTTIASNSSSTKAASTATSIMQKNAMTKKENELKLKFVVEKIKSKLNSAQQNAAGSLNSSNNFSFKANETTATTVTNSLNSALQPHQTTNSKTQILGNEVSGAGAAYDSIRLKVSPNSINQQHTSGLMNELSSNGQFRQNGFSNMNIMSEETIDLYSPPTPPSSSNMNANKKSNNTQAQKCKYKKKCLFFVVYLNSFFQYLCLVLRVYDPDKHCGVTTEIIDPHTGVKSYSEPCLRSLTCKVLLTLNLNFK